MPGVVCEGDVRPLLPKKREMRPEDLLDIARLNVSNCSQNLSMPLQSAAAPHAEHKRAARALILAGFMQPPGCGIALGRTNICPFIAHYPYSASVSISAQST